MPEKIKKKLHNVWMRMLRITFYSDLHATRFWLAGAELLWSYLLMQDDCTFCRPTYSVMAHVMSEEAWAMAFLAMGMTQLSILLSGDYHSRFSVWFAAMNQAFWWFVVCAMYQAVASPAAISGETMLACASSWVWIRSGYMQGRGQRSTDIE